MIKWYCYGMLLLVVIPAFVLSSERDIDDLDTREIDHAVLMASVTDFYKDYLEKQQQRLNELADEFEQSYCRLKDKDDQKHANYLQQLEELEQSVDRIEGKAKAIIHRYNMLTSKALTFKDILIYTCMGAIVGSIGYLVYRVIEAKIWSGDEISAVTNDHDNTARQL